MVQAGVFLLLELFEEPENQLGVLFEVLPLERGRNPSWVSLLMREPESFSLDCIPEKRMHCHNGHPVLFILFLYSFCSSRLTEEQHFSPCLKPRRDLCDIAGVGT